MTGVLRPPRVGNAYNTGQHLAKANAKNQTDRRKRDRGTVPVSAADDISVPPQRAAAVSVASSGAGRAGGDP